MQVITVHIGNRESVTFKRTEQYTALANAIGEQWARYAFSRHLAFGENVVKAGEATITWTVDEC